MKAEVGCVMKLREKGSYDSTCKVQTPSQHKVARACRGGAIRGKGKMEKKKSKTGKQE